MNSNGGSIRSIESTLQVIWKMFACVASSAARQLQRLPKFIRFENKRNNRVSSDRENTVAREKICACKLELFLRVVVATQLIECNTSSWCS